MQARDTFTFPDAGILFVKSFQDIEFSQVQKACESKITSADGFHRQAFYSF